MKIKIINIDTPTLGDRSYLIHDGKSALVIDPQRDIDRVQDLLSVEGVSLAMVAETHMHNDYVSGGLELAQSFGVGYLISQEEKVLFGHIPVGEQEIIEIGTFAIRVHRSPGHTFHHMSFELLNHANEVIGLFTGGSILHGATGRPDLLGEEFSKTLATLQYESAQRVAGGLSDSIEIYPTHGFGSFCSATPTTSDASTLGDERKNNPVFLQSEADYLSSTIAQLDAYPRYFQFMGAINTSGPAPLGTPISRFFSESLQTPLHPHDVINQLIKKEWVVDLRERNSWAAGHLKGAISLGLDGSMASYLGWLIPFGDSITLISDNEQDFLIAKRELIRIGIDNVKVVKINFDDIAGLTSTNILKFIDLEDLVDKDILLLDVRQNLEREKGYIDPSLHIPLHELETRIDEIPQGVEIWIHCGSGYRAAAAIGILERFQMSAHLIDDLFESARLPPHS